MSELWGLQRQLVERAGGGGFDRWWGQAAATGFCARPVRLVGRAGLADERMVVSCRNRRGSVCAPCSATYRADTWQLVAAGLRGGKGVPAQVGEHPRLFVTLTAPGFGPVHSTRARGGGSRVCRPPVGAGAGRCRHGRLLSCGRRHRPDDPLVGSALCGDCFDFAGVVLWNSRLPELWRRTTIYLQQALAAQTGRSVSALRSVVRLSFTRVAEYQARGCVHLHVVLRADGVDPADPAAVLPPPGWVTARLLTAAVQAAVPAVRAPLPPAPGTGLREAVWGAQLDVRTVRPASELANPTAIAAYVAKYATKAAETVTAGLERPIRTLAELAARRLPEHAHRLVQTCLLLHRDPELAELGLRRWAHMLGFGGHFSSRSRRYSVTLGALRAARRAWQEQQAGRSPAQWAEPREDGGWRFVGQGWQTEAEELLVRRPRAAGCWRWRRRGSNDGSSGSRSPGWPEEADMTEHEEHVAEQAVSGSRPGEDAQQWASLLDPAGASSQLLLTVPEAAAVLRMSRAKLYALMRSGQVLSVLIGGSRRVPRTAVLAYIAELTAVAEREQAERRQADRRGVAVDWRSSWARFGLDRPA